VPLHLITPASLQPVTLAEAKLHLKETSSAEDSLITMFIASATQECESILGRPLLDQIWGYYDESFPDVIELPMPIRAVNSIRYKEPVNGTLLTLNAAEYQADLNARYAARIQPANTKSWPSVQPNTLDAVQVSVQAGYADAASVPSAIKHWCLLRIGAYFANREAWTEGRPIIRNEFVDRLLDPFVSHRV
jgi:uncharacterized phiE125 gp8 family phage protein